MTSGRPFEWGHLANCPSVRIEVLEPVALLREVLTWHVQQIAEGDDRIELVASGSASEPDVFVTWTGILRDQVDQNQKARVVCVAAPGQKAIRSNAELKQLLLGAVSPKRTWTAPAITPDKPSRQELIVLAAVAEGLTATQIGVRLGISQHTVEGHRRRLFRRWGVHSSLEAIQLAEKHGLLANRSRVS